MTVAASSEGMHAKRCSFAAVTRLLDDGRHVVEAGPEDDVRMSVLSEPEPWAFRLTGGTLQIRHGDDRAVFSFDASGMLWPQLERQLARDLPLRRLHEQWKRLLWSRTRPLRGRLHARGVVEPIQLTAHRAQRDATAHRLHATSRGVPLVFAPAPAPAPASASAPGVARSRSPRRGGIALRAPENVEARGRQAQLDARARGVDTARRWRRATMTRAGLADYLRAMRDHAEQSASPERIQRRRLHVLQHAEQPPELSPSLALPPATSSAELVATMRPRAAHLDQIRNDRLARRAMRALDPRTELPTREQLATLESPEQWAREHFPCARRPAEPETCTYPCQLRGGVCA
jgi:hypothetical protein